MVYLVTRLWVGLDITINESPQILIKKNMFYITVMFYFINCIYSNLEPCGFILKMCTRHSLNGSGHYW